MLHVRRRPYSKSTTLAVNACCNDDASLDVCLDFKKQSAKNAPFTSETQSSNSSDPIRYGRETKIEPFTTITICAAWLTASPYVSVQYALCVPPCPVSSKSGRARAPPAHGTGVACRCIIILLLLA